MVKQYQMLVFARFDPEHSVRHAFYSFKRLSPTARHFKIETKVRNRFYHTNLSESAQLPGRPRIKALRMQRIHSGPSPMMIALDLRNSHRIRERSDECSKARSTGDLRGSYATKHHRADGSLFRSANTSTSPKNLEASKGTERLESLD